METFETVYRSISEMREPGFRGLKDPYGVLAMTEQKRRAFRANPYLSRWNDYCQQVKATDGVAFGGEIQFPLLVDLDGQEIVALSGSTTFVAKEYRKTEAGMSFGKCRTERSPGHYSCGSAMSQMMVKYLRYFKIPILEMPRYILLFRSRSVVESKLSGTLAGLVSGMCDIALKGIMGILSCLARFKTRGLSFTDVNASESDVLEEVAALIRTDRHRFKEVHDAAWLKWMMTESFDNDPMKLTAVRKDGRLVAFYMTKVRFHEQASSRGFKNVWLASIMEWETVSECSHLLKWVLLRAALSQRRMTDACEILLPDAALCRFFKSVGARQVGNGNYTISPPPGTHPECEADLQKSGNWRLRPALCDAGLN